MPIGASGTNKTDDAPAIRSAFSKCNHGGKIEFSAPTYYVNSVLNVTGLENIEVDIKGKLLWSTDITYWLYHSLPVGYQNQSTAFVLSGNNVRINGHGIGNLDGNGDYWYQWIKKQPNTLNYPGRPHQITFNGLTNSVVKGLSFFRSQMWTMSIINSHNNVLEGILVNNTGNVVSSSNTDGANTMFSSNITMRNWTVYNGDDSIAIKANSTNISILNSKFYNGLGIAIGSIGQYSGHFETIESLRGIEIDGMVGSSKSNRIASLQCSAEKPCTDITLQNIDLELSNGTAADNYLCGNVVDAKGWACTGKVCEAVTHGLARVNGIRLHYVTAGFGPALLLLHGTPKTHYYCPDLRGFGATDKPPSSDGYDGATNAKDMISLMDQLGHSKFAIHSEDRGATFCEMVLSARLTAQSFFTRENIAGHYNQTGLLNWHIPFLWMLHVPEMLIQGREEEFWTHFHEGRVL
ncbi:hypothetical protein PMIN06_008689 [Paraphaeosphaeria minitans]